MPPASPSVDPIDAWVRALLERHAGNLTRTELLKSVRALSARYVERRADLQQRSPIDSAGKRAAFAAFYAPLHLLTVRGIVQALGDDSRVPTIADLGCGTGAAAAGWALATGTRPQLTGIDHVAWALSETLWNWRALGLAGRTRRENMVTAADRMAHDRPAGPARKQAVVVGWAVNELDSPARDRLLRSLVRLGQSGTTLLVVEPIARTMTPWWSQWCDVLGPVGGRATEWKLDATLPPSLASIDRDAGFHRATLAARSLWVPGLP